MIVRHGKAEDIPRCLEMSENFYKVAGYDSVIPFCAESSEVYFEAAMEMGLFSVAEKGGLVGFILGLSIPFLMNKSYLVGTELAWWVEPEYRSTNIGVKLLEHIEKSAEEAGCVMWSMMCLESQAPEKMEELYLKLGYEPRERTFTKVLKRNL